MKKTKTKTKKGEKIMKKTNEQCWTEYNNQLEDKILKEMEKAWELEKAKRYIVKKNKCTKCRSKIQYVQKNLYVCTYCHNLSTETGSDYYVEERRVKNV